LADEIAASVVAHGDQSVAHFKENIETMLTTLKENISIGRVYRLEAGPDETIDTYQHTQANRGVNAVIVVVKGASEEVAHEIALHIAFARPQYLTREDVPQAEIDAERKTIEEITRNEGKPEAAIPKILEGRLNGWFKDRVLLEQPYVQDEKETVAQFLKGATISAYAQVVIGG
jgi:elongation factor Ts